MPSVIGSANPKVILYLPNPPEVDAGFDMTKPDITQLIAANGNHWRKILTIFAKLTCGQQNWKTYRDTLLLQHHEMICFDDCLYTSKLAEQSADVWHLVAGKASWQRLGFNPQDFTALEQQLGHKKDQQQRVFYHRQLILIPYPDYRQLPNQLIEQLKVLMAKL